MVDMVDVASVEVVEMSLAEIQYVVDSVSSGAIEGDSDEVVINSPPTLVVGTFVVVLTGSVCPCVV